MHRDPALSAFDTTQVTPPPRKGEVIVVSRNDLPLCCPRPGHELWNMHPRVWLPIEDDPNLTATCPYCGARYRLEG